MPQDGEIVAEPLVYDHERLRPLPAYATLHRALAALQRAVPGLGLSEVGLIAQQAAAGLSCAEPCPRCSIPAALRWAAPWRIEAAPDGDSLAARFRCTRCGATWKSTYEPAADTEDLPVAGQIEGTP